MSRSDNNQDDLTRSADRLSKINDKSESRDKGISQSEQERINLLERLRELEVAELARAEAEFESILLMQNRTLKDEGSSDNERVLQQSADKIARDRASRWDKILGERNKFYDTTEKPQSESTSELSSKSVQEEKLDIVSPDNFLKSPQAERIREIEIRNRSRQTADIERLKSVINNFAKTVPQSTLEEKKKLGRWITAELAQFGLAVECPDTPGLPVEVKGEVAKSAGSSRFQFSPLKTGDGPKRRGVFRDVLPDLNFVQLTNSVDLSPSAKPETGWRER